MHPLTQAKEIIVAIAAAFTAAAAVAALFRWRNETVWRENRDLARSLVRACIGVRDGFAFVRNPFIALGEFPDQPKSAQRRDPEDKYRQDLHVFENRLKILAAAMEDLEAAATEVEVLWGSEIEDHIRALRGCRRELSSLIGEHLGLVRSDMADSHGGKERWQEVNADMYATHNEDDEFSETIRAALRAILDIAEPYLRR